MKRTLEALMDKAGTLFPALENYALKKGDIMLELVLDQTEPEYAVLCLKKREKALYSHKSEKVDLAEISGIEVPDNEEISVIRVLYPKEVKELTKKDCLEKRAVPLGDDWVVRDDLIEAMANLFTTIRAYESQQIFYEKAYDGAGIDRPAIVAVTNMDVLERFNLEELGDLDLPATYNSTNERRKILHLPKLSSGCEVYIMPITCAEEQKIELPPAPEL